MKKRVISVAIATSGAISLNGLSVMAQTSETSQTATEQISVAEKANNKTDFDKKTLVGTVISCEDSTIIIQTLSGKKGHGENTLNSYLTDKEINSSETFQTPPQKDEEGVNNNLPEKTDKNKIPQGEEITVELTDSTLIYSLEGNTQTQINISDITEGTVINVEITDNSDIYSQEVTAQNIIIQKERPERQKNNASYSQSNKSGQTNSSAKE